MKGHHPLHPPLVHFPVALWTAAVVAETGGWLRGEPVWWLFSFVALAAGTGMGLLAMVAGGVDFAAIPDGHPGRDSAITHMMVMGLAWVLFLASLVLRGLPPEQAPPVSASLLLVAGFAVLVPGGWLGGRLVYDHGVGVRPHARQQE